MQHQSLTKEEKLKKRWEFEKVYKQGKRYWNKNFAIYVLPNGMPRTRLGLTVSKKVGNSVQRNRVKRLIRESFRLSKEHIMSGYDIVVVAQKNAYGLKYQQAQSALLSLLHQAGIVKRKTVNGKRRTESGGQRTENGEQKTEHPPSVFPSQLG